MNFIKVNELYKKVIEHCDYCENQDDFHPQKCKVCDFDYVSDLIDNCEKFDAIPVDYIWQQVNKEINEENRITKKIGTLPTTTVSYAYSKLIEKWEKDNADISTNHD